MPSRVAPQITNIAATIGRFWHASGHARNKHMKQTAVSAQHYDIVTIGGGIAASALAKAMAERGARVLVLEPETQFKDRMRGEGLVSWGGGEARELGIYDY